MVFLAQASVTRRSAGCMRRLTLAKRAMQSSARGTSHLLYAERERPTAERSTDSSSSSAFSLREPLNMAFSFFPIAEKSREISSSSCARCDSAVLLFSAVFSSCASPLKKPLTFLPILPKSMEISSSESFITCLPPDWAVRARDLYIVCRRNRRPRRIPRRLYEEHISFRSGVFLQRLVLGRAPSQGQRAERDAAYQQDEGNRCGQRYSATDNVPVVE